jgi:hypothetical protein
MVAAHAFNAAPASAQFGNSLHHKIRPRTFGEQIAHQNNARVNAVTARDLQELNELHSAAVQVAYDKSCHSG